MADNEHNVTININGNASSAVGAFGRVVSSLRNVRTAVSNVMNAFGVFGMAMNGVNMLADGFKWLREKITETAREMAKMRFDISMRSAASETERLIGLHDKLAKLLKDELDTLSKQREINDIEDKGKKDYEDGKREADRARQIFEAKTPEEEQALRDKFAAEDEQRARDERKKERKSQIKTLDEEESVYTSKANGLKNNNRRIDDQVKEEEFNLVRATNEDDKKAIKARIDALKKRKEANEAEIAQFEKEAKFRRDKIAAIENQRDSDGLSVASIKVRQREKEKARENDNATKEADQKWNDRQKRDKEKREVDDAVESQKNATDKKKILEAQANNNRVEANTLRDQYEEEMKKDPSVRDAKKLEELRRRIDELESDADNYENRGKAIEKEENEKKASDLESFSDRISAADGVSQNRLTAMGLGSGVSAKGDVSSDVRKLVDLMRQQVAATKENKPVDGGNVAVFGE